MDSNPSGPENHSPWQRYGHEFVVVFRIGSARLLKRWWQFLLIIAIGVTLFLIDRGELDTRALQQIRQPDSKALVTVAKSLSFWGDVIWAVILAAILFAVGVKLGSPRWRQTAYACMLAVLASTIIVNAFRCTLGRPRPYTGIADGFYGPHLEHKYHSFPSGHATSGYAPAAAIAAASPLLGVPCLIFAGTVSWSRLQLNQHHPLDIMTGAALGTLIGLCFGSAVDGAKYRMRGSKAKL